jgi:hypothetical protein
MKARAKRRGAITAKVWPLRHTIEMLRGHLVELEILLRDVALSGEASNDDLGVELVVVAGRVAHNAVAIMRACHRIREMGWRPARLVSSS